MIIKDKELIYLDGRETVLTKIISLLQLQLID